MRYDKCLKSMSVVVQNFGYFRLPYNCRHPYHISSPKVSPQAKHESINVELHIENGLVSKISNFKKCKNKIIDMHQKNKQVTKCLSKGREYNGYIFHTKRSLAD